jgi:benzaldehyde dehydrogenase (NAD)
VEKATGETLCTFGLGAPETLEEAVRLAQQAQTAWELQPPKIKADVLREIARLIQEEADTIRDWVVRETGAIAPKADFEINKSAEEFLEAAALTTQPLGHILPGETGEQSFARRVPIGVVGVITPWNFPLYLAARSIAPALAAGNAVILKPDVQTAVSGGLVLAHILARAGVPSGLFHVLPGPGSLGASLVQHPGVRMISFTGSTAVGRGVGETCGRMLKRCLLELGGNNCLIVLDDADVDAASSAAAFGAFFHQGQICMAASRFLVHRSVAAAFSEKLAARAARLPLGDPAGGQVALGPLINARQADKVERIIAESVAAGARIMAGGSRDGLFFPATVLIGVSPEMPAFREEIFGPVAPITTFETDDEAIALAHDTDYGLAAAIHTANVARGLALAQRLRVGMVHVNGQTVAQACNAPFGGMGASGNGGRFGALTNLDEFSQWQWITAHDRPPPYPF